MSRRNRIRRRTLVQVLVHQLWHFGATLNAAKSSTSPNSPSHELEWASADLQRANKAGFRNGRAIGTKRESF